MEPLPEKIGKYKLIDISGQVTGSKSYYILDVFKELLTENEIHFALNLDNLLFIDSLGIGAIMYFRKKISEKNGSVAIVGTNPVIEELIFVLNVSRFFVRKKTLKDLKE